MSETIADANGKVIDESLSGTIHPSAEGYAAVADKIYAFIPATLKTSDAAGAVAAPAAGQ